MVKVINNPLMVKAGRKGWRTDSEDGVVFVGVMTV